MLTVTGLALALGTASATDAVRSGAFQLSSTMLELAGEEAAAVVASVIEPDGS